MLMRDSKDTACFGVSCYMMLLFNEYKQVEDVPTENIATLQGMYITIGAMMLADTEGPAVLTRFSDLHQVGQQTILEFIHRPGMYEAVQDNIFRVPDHVPDDL